MRLEIDLLPILIGLLAAFFGVVLAACQPPSWMNRAVAGLMIGTGVGPAVFPGHGEFVVVQAVRLLFLPHTAAIITGLVFVIVWSMVAFILARKLATKKALTSPE